jgi:hypothetical protein
MENPPTRPSAAIAIVVLLISVGWIKGSRGAEDELAHYAALLVGLFGVWAAVAVWRGASHALTAYVAWAVTAFVVHTALDVRAEPVLWKVALGTAASGAILFGIGMWLRTHRSSPAG